MNTSLISQLPEVTELKDGDQLVVNQTETSRADLSKVKEYIQGDLPERIENAITEVKEYTDQLLSGRNEWLAPVNKVTELKTAGLDKKINYLCKVIADDKSGVYQCIAGWEEEPEWTLFDDAVDFVSEEELEAGINKHDTSDVAHNDIRRAVGNEARERERQITGAVNAESQAREASDQNLQGQIDGEIRARARGDAKTLNAAKSYTDGKAADLSSILDGAQALALKGEFLTRAINGTTYVAINLFDPSTVFVADKTLIGDANGTLGVYRHNLDGATIIVETLSVSPISPKEPTKLGNVNRHADLPLTANDAVAIKWNTPCVDDYAKVLRDETFGDKGVEWYIKLIDEEGNITWGDPVVLNTSDYQEQTAAEDAGRVLIGGATPGTYGESKPIDAVPSKGSANLITSDAVYWHGGKKCAAAVVGTELSGHTGATVDYLCSGANDELVINEALSALRANGGELLMLDGQYNLGDGVEIGDNIVLRGTGNGTVINMVASGDPNPFIIKITGDNSQIKDLKVKNSLSGKSITYGVENIGDYNIIKDVLFDVGASNYITVVYAVCNRGNHAIIANNIFKHFNAYTTYVIYLAGGRAIVTDNIIDVESQYKIFCFYIQGDGNIIHGNSVSCSVTDYPNDAYALCYRWGSYNSFQKNNLSGVTKTSPAGSAYTVNGNNPAQIPGSDRSVGVLGDGGVCGFNAGTENPDTGRYLASYKMTDGQDYLTFNIETASPYFANGISGDGTFANISNEQFFNAMLAYSVTLREINKAVTIGGAGGYWRNAYVNHLCLIRIDANTIRILLNTSNSAYTYEITPSSNALQFAVNVSMTN